MQDQEMMRIARRRAGAKTGFLIHLSVFAVVNVVLFMVNQSTTPGFAWHRFPLGGWAIGLALHGLAVLLSTSGLRENMVDAELRKLERQRDAGLRQPD